jgi:hypothetical protein
MQLFTHLTCSSHFFAVSVFYTNHFDRSPANKTMKTMATVAEDQTSFQSIVRDVLSFDDFVVLEEPDLLRLFSANPAFNEFKLRAIRNRARARDQGKILKIKNKIMLPSF